MGKFVLRCLAGALLLVVPFGCDLGGGPTPKAEQQVHRAVMNRIGRSMPGARVGKITFREQAADIWEFEAEIKRGDDQRPVKATGTWSPGRPVTTRIDREDK
jgi:hypothetical protein